MRAAECAYHELRAARDLAPRSGHDVRQGRAGRGEVQHPVRQRPDPEVLREDFREVAAVPGTARLGCPRSNTRGRNHTGIQEAWERFID